jgi:cytochrome bd-type quinol oxidase subunit 1
MKRFNLEPLYLEIWIFFWDFITKSLHWVSEEALEFGATLELLRL